MFLIDDLLLLPIDGMKFVFRTLAKVAEEQYTDDAPVKERLLELQVRLEAARLPKRNTSPRRLRSFANCARSRTASAKWRVSRGKKMPGDLSPAKSARVQESPSTSAMVKKRNRDSGSVLRICHRLDSSAKYSANVFDFTNN